MTDQPGRRLMLGDVTGIGPEICVKLLNLPASRQWARVVAVGDLRVLRQGMADCGQQLDVHVVRNLDEIDWDRPESALRRPRGHHPCVLHPRRVWPPPGVWPARPFTGSRSRRWRAASTASASPR